MSGMFLEIAGAILKMLDDDEGCKNFIEKVTKFDNTKLLNSFLEVAKPMRCGFQVLNHGDTWLNNMMFKSDEEGNPIDVSMIDYQISFWATPSADFLYFMMTSIADDVKVAHFDELLEFYHDHLTASLKKLEFKQHIPTLKELQDDLHEHAAFGLC